MRQPKSKVGMACVAPPHGNIRSKERGNGFHKLPESQAACQTVATYDVRKQRIQEVCINAFPMPRREKEISISI